MEHRSHNEGRSHCHQQSNHPARACPGPPGGAAAAARSHAFAAVVTPHDIGTEIRCDASDVAEATRYAAWLGPAVGSSPQRACCDVGAPRSSMAGLQQRSARRGAPLCSIRHVLAIESVLPSPGTVLADSSSGGCAAQPPTKLVARTRH